MLEKKKATTSEKKVDASELAQILQKLPEDMRQKMLYMAQGAILLSMPLTPTKQDSVGGGIPHRAERGGSKWL